MDSEIILPADFRRPRYFDGRWLDSRTRWSNEDCTILAGACALQIRPDAAANTLGRAPTMLAHKAIDLGIRLPRDWWQLIRKPRLRQRHEQLLEYPYIRTPDERHGDVLRVVKLVRHMEGREDVCQDILLALWQSETTLDSLSSDPVALRKFVTAFRRASFERGGNGVESLDTPLPDGRSKHELVEYGRRLIDGDDEFLEGGIWHRYEDDFADRVIENISAEEERTGVPAALWAPHELQRRIQGATHHVQ